MRKQWLVGSSVAIIVVAVAAGLVVSRAKSGEGPDGKGKKPEVTLEFTPAEVVKPVLTAMPERIEFSGALMAPRTAVVRAKANGTLLTLAVAEGSRVKTGQVLGTIVVTAGSGEFLAAAAARDRAEASISLAREIGETASAAAAAHALRLIAFGEKHGGQRGT